jgi:hypothetical protein
MRISVLQTITATALVLGGMAISVLRTNFTAQAAEVKKAAPYTTWNDYLGNADSHNTRH